MIKHFFFNHCFERQYESTTANPARIRVEKKPFVNRVVKNVRSKYLYELMQTQSRAQLIRDVCALFTQYVWLISFQGDSPKPEEPKEEHLDKDGGAGDGKDKEQYIKLKVVGQVRISFHQLNICRITKSHSSLESCNKYICIR